MPISHIEHYNLRAKRPLLNTLRDFYVHVVGLTAGYRPPLGSHNHWLHAGDWAVLHLSEALPDETRPVHVRSTFDHVAFACLAPGGDSRHTYGLRASITAGPRFRARASASCSQATPRATG